MSIRKIIVTVIVLIVLAAGAVGTVRMRRTALKVQTARVARQDLASAVTASGEIKPRKYINISASATGRIQELLVKEGDRVKKGQLLGSLESIQPGADLESQRANIRAAEADSTASEAALKAADDNIKQIQRAVDRARNDLEQARTEFGRAQTLLEHRLISRQDFESKQVALKNGEATLSEAQDRIGQARAQREQSAAQLAAAQAKVLQARASLQRLSDILHNYNFYAPLDGVVTNLPVRVGETVVPGIQNSSGSSVMTIADVSLITADVKVDETEIVTIQLGQPSEIKIDAIPGQVFTGKVIEIGTSAILRSTGVAASDSAVSSQEAKDFKVVVALDSPPEVVRPGVSCTAKITTATRKKALAVPLQAVTVRQSQQGVFVVRDGKAEFRRVSTGISATLEIEVTDGLQEGDEIITGAYQVIRTLRSGAEVTVDNRAPA
jgi:HlyD family secretion protein